MSLELDKLSKKLARNGFQIAADEVIDLTLSLMERGLIPEKIIYSPELGETINEMIGAELADNVRLHDLWTWNFNFSEAPQEWIEVMRACDGIEKRMVNRALNGLVRQGIETVGQVRTNDLEEVMRVSDESKKLVKVIFVRAEE